MDSLYLINMDFNPEDFEPIKNMVRDNAPFIAPPTNIENIYCLEDFIHASNFGGITLKALVDNNVLTRAISLAKGEEIAGNEESQRVLRLSCAIMCFFILSDFQLEPNIAIYEKASRTYHRNAQDELFYFRVADHIHPRLYASLALGRINKLPNHTIEHAKNLVRRMQDDHIEKNFSKTLNSWKMNYLFVLKAAMIWKSDVHGLKRAQKFLEWMVQESFFNAVASIFILLFLSPSRLSKMIRGINSESRKKFSNGLRNCAWDLTYIS